MQVYLVYSYLISTFFFKNPILSSVSLSSVFPQTQPDMTDVTASCSTDFNEPHQLTSLSLVSTTGMQHQMAPSSFPDDREEGNEFSNKLFFKLFFYCRTFYSFAEPLKSRV